MEDREPCPWRILDDVGGAFLLGEPLRAKAESKGRLRGRRARWGIAS